MSAAAAPEVYLPPSPWMEQRLARVLAERRGMDDHARFNLERLSIRLTIVRGGQKSGLRMASMEAWVREIRDWFALRLGAPMEQALFAELDLILDGAGCYD